MQSFVKELKFHITRETSEEPLVDLYETDTDLVFEIDLPGMDPDNISIKIFENLLIIEGIKRVNDRAMKTHKYLCMERSMDGFRRAVKIPVAVNSMEGKAVYSQGVVKVILPKIKKTAIRIKIEKQEGD